MALPAFSANTWTLDGLSFNTGNNPSGFSYLILRSIGWKGSPPRLPDQTKRPDANGNYRGPNSEGARVVQLEGIAQCASRAQRDALADSLEGLCRSTTALYPLVRNELGRSLQLFVEVQGTVGVTEMPDGCTVGFNVQLIANDARKFSTVVNSVATGIAQAPLDGILWSGTPGNTGTEWNGPSAPITGLVWQASSGTTGVMSLTNNGNASTPVLFRVDGPGSGTLVQPTITNTTTGAVLTYSGTLVPGDILLIDTGTRNVTLNGASGAGQMSRADFFELPPHTTTVLQFSAAAPATGALLAATWSDAF